MAQLGSILPPGEMVRWTSTTAIQPWRIVIAIAAFSLVWLAMLPEIGWALGIAGTFGIPVLVIALMALLPEAEVAVTDQHVVWLYPMDLFGKASCGRSGVVARETVKSVELEEGGGAITLHGDGFSHRIEEVAGGQLETLAAVIGRPTRVWRACSSMGAMRARNWHKYAGLGVLWVLLMGFAAVMGGFSLMGLFDRVEWVVRVVSIVAGGLLMLFFAGLAERTLPHFLVGRRLGGDGRRDFVGWMTDLRWRGVKPDGSDDKRLPRSRLQDWAMRVAYGEIPDIGERGPEILIPGQFPTE